MKIRDGYKLARTKFHSRRTRIAITASICSLLFALLFAAGFVIQGAANVKPQINDQGFNNHYLAEANSMAQNNGFGSYQKQVETQMDMELRARHIIVTDAVRNSQAYQNESQQRQSALLLQKYDGLEAGYINTVKATYHPSSIYSFRELAALNNNGFIDYPGQSDTFLSQQRQQIDTGTSPNQHMGQPTVKTPINPTFNYTDASLLKPLLFPGQSFDWKPGQPYPLLIPQTFLLRYSGTILTQQSSKQQLETYKRLMQKYAGTSLNYCYRNATAQSQLLDVLQYNKSIATGATPKARPLATDACTGFDQTVLKKLHIISDEEDAKTALFPKPTQIAVTKSLQFKIVGYIPTADVAVHNSVLTGFINGINQWGPAAYPAIMPTQVYEQESLFTDDSSQPSTGGSSAALVFADFSNRSAQARYISSGCQGLSCYKGATWQISSFGNLNVALQKAISSATRVSLIIGGILGGFALLLILSSTSRIISDSRREIAVFRSLGARPLDIVQIYLTYGCMIAGVTVSIALLLSIAIALYVSANYSATLASNMSLAIGAIQKPLDVHLFGINVIWIGLLVLIMLCAACTGVLVSLALHGRRNLMRLTKEE